MEALRAVWLVIDNPATETLLVRWEATATNAEKRVSGSFVVPVPQPPTSVEELPAELPVDDDRGSRAPSFEDPEGHPLARVSRKRRRVARRAGDIDDDAFSVDAFGFLRVRLVEPNVQPTTSRSSQACAYLRAGLEDVPGHPGFRRRSGR